MTNKDYFNMPTIEGCLWAMSMHKRDDALQTLSHYTDTGALDIILKTGTLRATSMFFLNDWQEYTGGLDCLKTVFRKYSHISKVLDDLKDNHFSCGLGIFSISFSDTSDNLQHWVTYSKESGVCIELDYETMLNAGYWQELYDAENNKKTYEMSSFCSLSRITYYAKDKEEHIDNPLSKEKMEELEENFKKYARDTMRSLTDLNEIDKEIENDHRLRAYLSLCASYFKTKGFEGEREIRACFFPLTDCHEKGLNVVCNSRLKEGILKPFIEVTIGSDNNGSPVSKIPIVGVIVGPSGAQDRLFQSIVHRICYGNTNAVQNEKPLIREQLKKYLSHAYKETNSMPAIEYILWKWNTTSSQKFCVSLTRDGNIYVSDCDGCASVPSQNDCAIDFMRENYLSPTGIWIRKSKIPYIF